PLFDGILVEHDARAEQLLANAGAFELDAQLESAPRVEDADDDLVRSFRQLRLARLERRCVDAVVVDDELVVDPQLAAVVAGDVEGVVAFGFDAEKALELQRAVIDAACNRKLEVGRLAALDGLDL